MMRINVSANVILTLAAAAALLVLSSADGRAQFYATIDEDGDTTVYDPDGAEVPIATADPVGERPLELSLRRLLRVRGSER